MKITRRQLKKIILNELRDTGEYDNFDIGIGVGGGNIPPVEPPRRGGGGGGDGEEPRDFSGRSNDPCGFGNPKGDYYYDLVFNSFGNWVETNYPLSLEDEAHNQELKSIGGSESYQNLITQPSKYLDYLHQEYPSPKVVDGVTTPAFHMDLLSDNYNEFFELIITAIAEYACQNNIRNVEEIYLDPMSAILNFF